MYGLGVQYNIGFELTVDLVRESRHGTKTNTGRQDHTWPQENQSRYALPGWKEHMYEPDIVCREHMVVCRAVGTPRVVFKGHISSSI